MPDTLVIRVTRQAVVLLLLALLGIWLAARLLDVLIVLLLAILLAIAVAPLARRLEAGGVPRGAAILLIYVAVVGVFALTIALLVPLVNTEIDQLQAAFPGYIALLGRYGIPALNPFESTQFKSLLSRFALRFGEFALQAVDVIATGVVTVVISFFMTVDERFAERVVVRLVPWRYQPATMATLREIGVQLGHWLRAQILIAGIFGTAMAVGLAIMGIPYPVTIGLLGGLVEIIPYVGGVVTVVLASLVALSVNPWLVLVVIAYYLVLANIESHVLFPALMGRAIGLHPLVVVLALFIGAKLLGIVGALLAIPCAVIIQILIDQFYANKPLHPAAEAEIEEGQAPTINTAKDGDRS